MIRNIAVGANLQSEINAASPGDVLILAPGTYNGGISVNRALTIQSATPRAAKLIGSTAQHAITIDADDVTIDGLHMDKFADGITAWGAARSRITIKNCYIAQVQYAVVAKGNAWLIEGNEMYRMRMWAPGDVNYIWVFGANHIIRRNYAWGTVLGNGTVSEVSPAGDTCYSAGRSGHVDFVQTFTNNGEVTDGVLIEENYATDFIDAVYTTDEGPGAVRNFTVRNNVFIGTNYQYKDASTPQETRQPPWGVAFAYGSGGEGLQIIENNLFHNITFPIRLNDGTKARVQGNIYSRAGQVYTMLNNSPANIDYGRGNWWASVLSYQVNAQPAIDKVAGCSVPAGVDACVLDPKFVNINTPLGADGLPMTADDGWRPTLAAALSYGPQLAVAPVPTPTPIPTPLPTPTPTLVWERVRVYNANGTVKGYRWSQVTQTDVKP